MSFALGRKIVVLNLGFYQKILSLADSAFALSLRRVLAHSPHLAQEILSPGRDEGVRGWHGASETSGSSGESPLGLYEVTDYLVSGEEVQRRPVAVIPRPLDLERLWKACEDFFMFRKGDFEEGGGILRKGGTEIELQEDAKKMPREVEWVPVKYLLKKEGHG